MAAEQRPQLNIRDIKEEDIEGVVAIDKKITGNERALTYLPTSTSYVGGQMEVSIVAEVGGQIVGFLLGSITNSPSGVADTALVQLMGVDLEYRRQGIGTKLAQGFMERCQKKGVRSVHIMVSWRDWWLLSFLRSLGFRRGEMADFVKPIED